MNIIQDVLIYQTQMMRNSSLGPYVPADFSPPEYIVVVNALFYASLGVMILAAFIAMLIKSWVREFDRGLRAMSLPEQRAKTREFRYLGLEQWKLTEMVAILPLLIQLSLLLFSIGLVLFLFYVSKPSFGITMSIFGVGVVYYTVTTFVSVFVTSSPFRSPLSRALGKVYQHLHAHFCPGVGNFLLPEMDTTPATALGRLRRHIQVFLLKWRPFLERDFVEPITATMPDEVQLFPAMSALERIHESVPNSQHSEALHLSVWQVAGGATFPNPPSFDLPSWILGKGDDEEFLSRLPPAMVVALVAFFLRAPRRWGMHRLAIARRVLRPVNVSESRWAQLVCVISDIVLSGWRFRESVLLERPSSDLANISRWNGLHVEECIWILTTLSEPQIIVWVLDAQPLCIGICLAIMSEQVPKWKDGNTANTALLDAVVTLLAVSCSADPVYQRETLSNNRKYPWLLLNLRNPEFISKVLEDAPPGCHKQLISLLFLVLYGLKLRGSAHLAVQYFDVITAKGDFPLYASALAAVAPALGRNGPLIIGSMLVAPRTEDLKPILGYSDWRGTSGLLEAYDNQLGASQNPDPNIIAILLVHPNRLGTIYTPGLKNPWLRLAATVITRVYIPDRPPVDMISFNDRRIHNMVAALYLLPYTYGEGPDRTEALFLASLLKPWEPVISPLALKYYLRIAISYPNHLQLPYHLSSAVRAVFNHLLPDHQLQMGWPILGAFVDGFEKLSVNWRQTFAEAFFTLSHQPLPRPQGGAWANTPWGELRKMLTWECFHKEEREPRCTDSRFSGLDWMAMAWSLHLSQQRGTMMVEGSTHGGAQPQDSDAPVINEEFVLRVLFKLLDATPYYQISPIIPKLREFIEWFGGPSLSEYRSMISVQMEEANRRHKEFRQFRQFHQFHSFHCTWYI